jgi:hypothetical protein
MGKGYLMSAKVLWYTNAVMQSSLLLADFDKRFEGIKAVKN